MQKRFWQGTFTLMGAIIGAGILGLPYVFARSGFLIGFFWLILLGIIITATKFYMAEVILRTKGTHQLTGYAEKYLGKWGKHIMLFAMLFGIYSALIAYLIGEGQSLSYIFTNSTDYSLYFALAFWFIITMLVSKGLHQLKKVESWGMIAVLIIITIIFALAIPKIQVENFTYTEPQNFFLPLGVILFAFMGFSSLPEVKREINGNERYFKKIIFTALILSTIVYLLFVISFQGVLGKEVMEVSTISFGKIANILGIFTMFSSYFVLSFALKDVFHLDYKISLKKAIFLASSVPLIIYLLISLFNLAGFITVLGIGGIISGGFSAITILIMNKKAKEAKQERKPEFVVPINKLIILLFSGLFIIGAIMEILL